jgi:hypothetical protein
MRQVAHARCHRGANPVDVGGRERGAKVIRGHWGIENGQHWTLDMAFHEDRSRSRLKNGPESFALLRGFALNFLKVDRLSKGSIRGKRPKAGWDQEYVLKVITAAVPDVRSA